MRLDLPTPPAPASAKSAIRPARHTLTEADAIDIWLARWLRVPIKDLVARYGCDSRRLYEVWWGEKYPRSRTKAEAVFADRFPGAVEHTAFGYRRIPRRSDRDDAQQELFKR